MANVLALVSFKVFPPHMGGQKGVVLFYEALAKHTEILMAASTDNWEKIEASFEVQKLLHPNKKMLRNVFVLPSLIKLVKQHRIDVVMAEHSYTGWLAWLLKMVTGKPFIIHSHNIETDRFRQMGRRGWKLYELYERWIHKKAAHVFFISSDDLKNGIKSFEIEESKASVVTYGIENPRYISNAKELLRRRYQIDSEYIFHFNGTLDYEPNIEAVEKIIFNINPLLKNSGLSYTILISGKRLSSELQQAILDSENIRYLDFVADIELLYQGCDVFLNPVVHDSGIKTKVVEALANHCTVVSSISGAAGLSPKLYGNKMLLAADENWIEFADTIKKAILIKTETPALFFEHFSWNTIAAKAAKQINTVIAHANKRS